MVSNVNNDYVYCKEHNHMIHKDNAKLIMQAADKREQEQESVINQVETMIAFSLGANAPSYLPKRGKGLQQAGLIEKKQPKNYGILPNMTDTFLEFSGLR
jgi:hypothetical protein